MPEGIQVYNDSGILQIDGTFRNLSLISTGSILCNNTSTEIPATYGDVVVPNSTSPLLAFPGIGNGVTCTVISVSGSNRTFRVFYEGNVSVTIPYYVFDVPDSTPTTFGLQVYNSSGQLCFDAAKKYMRVLDFYTNNPVFPNSVSKTYPGKTVALIPTTYSRGVVGVIPMPTRYQWSVAWGRIIGSNQLDLHFGSVFISTSGSGDPLTGGNPQNGWLVIDITNY